MTATSICPVVRQENDRLSTARALTVFAERRQQQPLLDDLRNTEAQPLLGVSGYGERRPLAGRARSRGAGR